MIENKTATCYFPYSDGALHKVEVHAQYLAEENREIAGIKLVNCDKKLQKHFKEVTENARLTEFNPDYHWKVSCYITPEITINDQSWQLAAIIADRAARGLLANETDRMIALGQSDYWETGQVQPLADVQHSNGLKNIKNHKQVNDTIYLASNQQSFSKIESQELEQNTANIQYITHLGGLTGQPDPNKAVRSATVYFPLINGNTQHDCLASITVTVLPLLEKNTNETALISCQRNLTRTQQRNIKETIEQSREWDKQNNNQWQTVIRFSRDDFQDQSYQLALVMADRIARGREVPAQNRLIATGSSTRWARGEVHNVEQQSSKLQLLLKSAHQNDRILLPSSWQAAIDGMSSWADKQVSIACIDKLA